MTIQDKIQQLKKNQMERVSRSFDYKVEEWDQVLKIRRLTMADSEKAKLWAQKHYRKKSDIASGVALVCLSVGEDALPLNKETVDFLLGEPVPVIKGLIDFVNEVSEISTDA